MKNPRDERFDATLASTPTEAGLTVDLVARRSFGRYRVLSLLGRGGMATVYQAHDTQLDRLVALKVPHFGPNEDAAIMQRFRTEAQAAASLIHPNICTVYDVGEIDGVQYLTMQHVRGRPLTDVIKKDGPLPVGQAALLVQQIAEAMEEAHKLGIVHRDLKPSNVMINERGAPVIMDFGLARRLGRAQRRITQQGAILGTPAYMPPEQLRGDLEAIGPRSDIYSLGVILYELVTGAVPFDGPPMTVIGKMMRGEPPRSPLELRPDLDPHLAAVFMKCIAPEIKDRHVTMSELARALGELLRGFQLFGEDREPGDAAETLSDAGAQLFRLGRWPLAYEVLSAVVELPCVEPLREARQRNRLILLCKNMDRWSEAVAHSDRCLLAMGDHPPDELAARVLNNRGSALYDVGRRDEAGEIFRKALAHANAAGGPLLHAAAANNLGIYLHYADRLDEAEAALRDGILFCNRSTARAYLETNLGLLLLTKSIDEPRYREPSEEMLAGQVEAFAHAGHVQGVSYALSNRAIGLATEGRFDEARVDLEETIRLGTKLGEKWTPYGALANLAWLELLTPSPRYEIAMSTVRESRGRARDNGDPKGIADSGLIAARVALDWAAQGGERALVDEARTILEETRAVYARLGQPRGERTAQAGLGELAGGPRFSAPPWHMLLLMELF